MFKPSHYYIEELVHPQIIKAIGETNSWARLDEGVLRDLDAIREKWHGIYGSGIYINRLDVSLDSRGLRPPNDPDGAFYSVHKQGKAIDLEPVNGMVGQLWQMVHDMIKNGELEAINTLEDFHYTGGWVHVAKMNTAERPLVVKP